MLGVKPASRSPFSSATVVVCMESCRLSPSPGATDRRHNSDSETIGLTESMIFGLGRTESLAVDGTNCDRLEKHRTGRSTKSISQLPQRVVRFRGIEKLFRLGEIL